MPGVVYNSLASQLRTDMREQMRIVRSHLEDTTRNDAPFISGDLRASIVMDDFIEFFDQFRSTIRATADQATYTNEGTGEYAGRGRIYGNPYLAFFWLKVGKFMVVRSIRGQPGQHWWEGPSDTRWEERMTDAVDAAFGI